MSPSRLDTLREMAAADPGDPFLRYGIAQEHVRLGDLARAVAEFEALRAQSPDYVATYYHLGQTLQKLGRIDDARRVLSAGIEVASRKGDLHARSELCDLQDMLDGA